MNTARMTFHAAFNQGQFLIKEHSPELPDPNPEMILTDYLNYLALMGWCAVRAEIEEMGLTVWLEKHQQIPYPLPTYLVQTLGQVGGGLFSVGANGEIALLDSFRALLREEGWKELATSRPMVIKSGAWIVSLWMKQGQNTGMIM